MPRMVGIAERCCAAWLKEGPGVSGFEKAKEYTFRVRPLQGYTMHCVHMSIEVARPNDDACLLSR